MHRFGNIIRMTVSVLAVVCVLLLLKKQVQAALYNPVTVTKIEIDGTNYGSIDKITGIQKFSTDGFPLTTCIRTRKYRFPESSLPNHLCTFGPKSV